MNGRVKGKRACGSATRNDEDEAPCDEAASEMMEKGASRFRPKRCKKLDEETEALFFERPLLTEEIYKVWRSHTPFLYDFIMAYWLPTPVLTVSWLPQNDLHHPRLPLVFGTCTQYKDEDDDGLVFGTIPNFAAEEHKKGQEFKWSLNFTIGAPIHLVRVMPQDPYLLATFDALRRIDLIRTSASYDKIERLHNIETMHARWGYAMDWNKMARGMLLSAAEDGVVALWDATSLKCVKTFTYSLYKAVNGVEWVKDSPNEFASVSDGGKIHFCDIREDIQSKTSAVQFTSSKPAVNCITFHPSKPDTFVTGNGNGVISVWDRRQTKLEVKSWDGHNGQSVNQIVFSPELDGFFSSAGSDNKVCLWNLSSQNSDPIFKHSGHTDCVFDVAWGINGDPWTLMSSAEDGVIHVWSPLKCFTNSH